MPSESAARDANGPPGDQNVERVLALLTEALGIVDALGLSPDIGAKIQEALGSLEHYTHE